MSRQSGKIALLIGITLATLNVPVYAENGEIVLLRNVQPRAATRQELVPDPNPVAVQAGLPKNAELKDSDFAQINSGISVSNRALTSVTNSLTSSNTLTQSSGNNLQGLGGAIGGSAGGGAGTSRISGRVNGAVQTGLRPLQNLGMGN